MACLAFVSVRAVFFPWLFRPGFIHPFFGWILEVVGCLGPRGPSWARTVLRISFVVVVVVAVVFFSDFLWYFGFIYCVEFVYYFVILCVISLSCIV